MANQTQSESALNRVRWITLLALTLINLLNYIDRYIFSALLPAIKADLKFTDTELGMLGSAFMFAYVFIAPAFGAWATAENARESWPTALVFGVSRLPFRESAVPSRASLPPGHWLASVNPRTP